MENVIHHSLEGSWATGHTKEYYQRFKNFTVSVK